MKADEMKEQIIKAIINSLGFLEDTEGHGYKLHIYKDEWWISHNIVGSGEPVKDWLNREIKIDDDKLDMKEKISAILDDYVIKIAFLGGNESMVAERTNARIRLIDELEKLYQQEYLNSCIEKATPALSKIKDVDKELAEIRGTDELAEKIAKTDYMDTEKTC